MGQLLSKIRCGLALRGQLPWHIKTVLDSNIISFCAQLFGNLTTVLGGAYWCPVALILFLNLLAGVLEEASALGGPHLGSKMRMRGAPLGGPWRQSPLMGEGVA